jgi:hypothetical protein
MRTWKLSSLRFNGAMIYVNTRTGEVAWEDCGHLISLPAQIENEMASRAAEELQNHVSAGS